jgi:hypothetical protein
MDRHLHRKHVPICEKNVPMVDQYMKAVKDTYMDPCPNGINHSIYNQYGHIHYSLPLEMYPKVNDIHPHIAISRNITPLFR